MQTDLHSQLMAEAGEMARSLESWVLCPCPCPWQFEPSWFRDDDESRVPVLRRSFSRCRDSKSRAYPRAEDIPGDKAWSQSRKLDWLKLEEN